MSFRKINHASVNTIDAAFTDSLIITGKDNTVPVDIGFLGKIGPSTYSGLVRDSETQSFLLIDQYTQTITNNDVDATSSSLIKGTLEVKSLYADESLKIPKGTTIQRPSTPEEGLIWFNTETKQFEGYDGTNWIIFLPAVSVINIV